jgi:hypothetical protein
LFPRDHPKNTRFSINFFTSIGLGGLTEALRTYLKNAPKQIMAQQAAPEVKSDSESVSAHSVGVLVSQMLTYLCTKHVWYDSHHLIAVMIAILVQARILRRRVVVIVMMIKRSQNQRVVVAVV